MNSRLPRSILVALAICGGVYFHSFYGRLPDAVASHFNGKGAPNGWQSKPAFLGTLLALTVATIVVAFGIPAIIRALPPEIVNLPNKKYWLSPEHTAETQQFLAAWFAWFGCALYVMILFAFHYSIQWTLYPDDPPTAASMLWMLGILGVFMVFWVLRLVRHFARTGDKRWGSV